MDKTKPIFYSLLVCTLIFMYLVVLAGGTVRVTDSGMGCPDWPKCFGQWIPPTDIKQLPSNYSDIFLEKRLNKLNKYTSLLNRFGFSELAKKIEKDPNINKEEVFKVRNTWIEYINRILGFIAGNLLLITTLWSLLLIKIDYRIFSLCFISLILTGFQAWFGSVVVTTRLMQWTISVHLFLALLIILILIHILSICKVKKQEVTLHIKLGIGIMFILGIIQIILGSEVRKMLDFILEEYTRNNAISNIGFIFSIHRSMSWLFILVILFLFINLVKHGLFLKRDLFIGLFIILEIIIGVGLNYFDVPRVLQPLHLLCAFIILGMVYYRYQSVKLEQN